MKPERDPFIDGSIRKEWAGEPVEYDGKPLAIYNQFHNPAPSPGLEVQEISIEEFLQARFEAARKREEAEKSKVRPELEA